MTAFVTLYTTDRSEPFQSRPSGLGLPNPKSIEENNSIDFFSKLPNMILKIFGYLKPTELAKSGEVSKRWRDLSSNPALWNAFDLRTISPSLKVFDESDWVSHVNLSYLRLDVTDAPSLDKRQAIPVLKRCLSSLPIEGNAGITLLTIPKGLTFNTLIKIGGSLKVGETPPYRHIWDRIVSEIGDSPVDKTYRIVITNGVFKKSRNLSVSDQKALVSKIGCRIPKVLEATVLLVVTFMSSRERLYSDNPWTFTRCSEKLAGYQLVIGGFSLDGVCVSHYYSFDGETYGVGGVLQHYHKRSDL